MKFAAQLQFATIAAQQLLALVCSAASSAESAASVLASATTVADVQVLAIAVAVASQLAASEVKGYYSTLASDRYESLPLMPV